MQRENHEGLTALEVACQEGAAGCVATLVDRGMASREYPYELGPVYLAAAHGQTESLAVLLHAGFSPNGNANEGVCAPLWMAMERGWESCARQLVLAGADIDILLSDGDSVLERAKREGWRSLIEALEQRILKTDAGASHADDPGLGL